VLRYPTNQLGDDGAQLTWITLALSSLVLLIACINLANLQIVRTTARSREIAIRLALGCPPWRLTGMFLLESVILSLAGGALGLALAVWSNAFVAKYFDIDIPLNLRVLAFTFFAALATAVLFGAVPTWLAARADIGTALKASGRGSTSDRSRHWLRQCLVLVELSLALTLLAGAGFFVSGIHRLTHRDLGWVPTHEVISSISPRPGSFRRGKEPRQRAGLRAAGGRGAAGSSRSPVRLDFRRLALVGKPHGFLSRRGAAGARERP